VHKPHKEICGASLNLCGAPRRGNSLRTILWELAAIHGADIVLPTDIVPWRDLRLGCVVCPDKAQAALLEIQPMKISGHSLRLWMGLAIPPCRS
jgi:hypothetical protein